MCTEQQKCSGSEPEEEPRHGRIHLRRGIVASRMQGRRRRRNLIVRMIVLFAIVAWILVWWYTSN